MRDFLSRFPVDFGSDALYIFYKYLIRIRIIFLKDTMATGHEIAMGLRVAYRAMHRQTDVCLAKLGVTANQFVLLALLAEEDRTTQQQLVRRACSDPNTVRAMLVLLESNGLVARRRHPDDGRALNVTLTRKGRRMYNKLWKESERLRQQLLELFQPKQAEAFLGLLKRISEAMI
jgi:DNA-binding MarR family transcriptional regulator